MNAPFTSEEKPYGAVVHQDDTAGPTIESLQARISQLETENSDAQRSRLAMLNVLEDAMAARKLAQDLNTQLQKENLQRRQIESDLRESQRQLQDAMESAKAAYKAKDQFIAALSHELRTPLAPVLLAASIAAHDPELAPAIKEQFAMIRANVEVEARLIDDLLDQTQMERGELRFTPSCVDLHLSLEEAMRTTHEDFRAKEINVITRWDAKAHFANADPVRIQQVFWNLLRNAAKFTPERGMVRIETQDSGENRIRILFSDTGIGLTADEIQRVFLPFTQGDHARAESKSPFGGLGLGLSISRRLVILHQGSIEVTSKGRGLGATFIVELPSSPTPSVEDEGNLQERTPEVPIHGLRILLVEDHIPTRKTLHSLLKRRGHTVTVAGSISEALRVSQQKHFHLIMSDLGLPDGSGCDLLGLLRNHFPSTPAIALSGYGMENDLAQTRAAGFSTHLVKPISVERLDAAIQSLQPGKNV